MIAFYFMFYGSIYFLIFSFLTKRIRLSRKTVVFLFGGIVITGILHFINPFGDAIPHEVFWVLLFFSLNLFVFHYGFEVTMWIATLIIKSESFKKKLIKVREVFIFQVIYLFQMVFQIIVLIKNLVTFNS